jgi:hypothetical protein
MGLFARLWTSLLGRILARRLRGHLLGKPQLIQPVTVRVFVTWRPAPGG